MPYRTEHAARQIPPDRFSRFYTVTPPNVAGVRFIVGVYKRGKGPAKVRGPGRRKSDIQAVRFKADIWAPNDAKVWLREHGFVPRLVVAKPKDPTGGGAGDARGRQIEMFRGAETMQGRLPPGWEQRAPGNLVRYGTRGAFKVTQAGSRQWHLAFVPRGPRGFGNPVPLGGAFPTAQAAMQIVDKRIGATGFGGQDDPWQELIRHSRAALNCRDWRITYGDAADAAAAAKDMAQRELYAIACDRYGTAARLHEGAYTLYRQRDEERARRVGAQADAAHEEARRAAAQVDRKYLDRIRVPRHPVPRVSGRSRPASPYDVYTLWADGAATTYNWHVRWGRPGRAALLRLVGTATQPLIVARLLKDGKILAEVKG
jgi:hypothetical protein